MSKKAKLGNQSLNNIRADEATEGFYVTVDNVCWPPNTVVYKSYSGELIAFGYGYLGIDKRAVMAKINLHRIPDDVEIIVQN